MQNLGLIYRKFGVLVQNDMNIFVRIYGVAIFGLKLRLGSESSSGSARYGQAHEPIEPSSSLGSKLVKPNK